ncbi:MAG: UTP--glucose-1-phosphate uridylyltransferase [Caldilineaceae bacterium]
MLKIKSTYRGVAMRQKPQDNGAAEQSSQAAHDLDERFAPFVQKMRAAELPAELIHTFRHYYRQLLEGGAGYIPTAQAQPVETLPTSDEFEQYRTFGHEALTRAVIIKLNGGLGTTMGLEGPKSLIPVKEGLTFLDMIVRQVLHLRQEHSVELPLVLMNSFNTEAATRQALAAYPTLTQSVPLDFRQHKVPKIWQHDFSPAAWPDDPEKEWCPPGHGNLYLTLYTSGLLTELLASGYEYAFISNVDNLGATLDLNLLGYFAEKGLDFLMEVAARTPADRKGGHLAHDPARGLILREVAQCPPDEMDLFQDITRYRYFNTNNIWINLTALKYALEARSGFLDLPLIRNAKPVDPTAPESPPVYQLETAMGQAIAIFPGAQAVQVGRARFLPVKSTSDLLALRSDLYLLQEDYTLQRNPARQLADDIVIELDDEYYRTLDQLEAHFPNGAPSLVNCRRLHIEGEVFFGNKAATE